ncbi:phage integrase SAM-like domain-containing protein [Limnohabitans sp. TS-CS-82]|uniref:tyrosine-type recombinase/integrase n=1 Tax=Limnohabitans sp. TS-CS-82 TaxID=2094193 RepID=UPI0011B02CEB|nr:phage integrase SAM-like domain-containing protein [Limnohabitans sp. TS-CS-82]
MPEKLKIFRIAGSKYWQVRIFSHGRYIGKSLKTTDVHEAHVLAKNFYNELVMRGQVDVLAVPDGDALLIMRKNQYLLHDLIEEILQRELERVARDEIKKESWLMTKIRLEGLVFDFLRLKPLRSINTKTVQDFVQFLTEKNLAGSTILGYLAHFRKLLKLLFVRGVISQMPLFPPVKLQLNSRGAFTVTEYKLILQKSKELTRTTYTDWPSGKRIWIHASYHTMPIEMNGLIRFMVYTFVRPGDVRQLQHKHIEIIKGQFNYLRLTLPEVKRHKAPIVSLPPAVCIYERLLARQKAQGFGRPDDYVFFPQEPNRRRMLDIIGWLFNWILKDLGIKQGPHGAMRSLYSLRHTAITFRLIFGGNIDLLTLARNARTSVEMIEKFYASTLSAEMNIALLHGKRGK